MKTKQLDDVDKEILKQLRKNCRRSYRELAKVINLSPAALIERIKKLEERGIVTQYVAVLNYQKLGFEYMGIINVNITKGALLEVQKKIAGFPNVATVYDITGEYDSAVVTICKNRHELSALIKKINNIPQVQKTNTNVILNVIKEMREFDAV
ncbi:MAG: Lrp/AsnC family transcriptional regulator [Candidatus Micrarchaeota archaeon]|nr:Lrp/AsnC family transcriptional regulator [Candidatus Micrarchaeota archaeon]